MSKEEILELLDEIVARIEGPALDLFHTFVAYHRTQAIVGLVVGALMVLGGALAVRAATKYEPESQWDTADIPLYVFGGCVILTGLILAATNLTGAIVPQVPALSHLIPGI